jgi:hypothetical protein
MRNLIRTSNSSSQQMKQDWGVLNKEGGAPDSGNEDKGELLPRKPAPPR